MSCRSWMDRALGHWEQTITLHALISPRTSTWAVLVCGSTQKHSNMKTQRTLQHFSSDFNMKRLHHYRTTRLRGLTTAALTRCRVRSKRYKLSLNMWEYLLGFYKARFECLKLCRLYLVQYKVFNRLQQSSRRVLSCSTQKAAIQRFHKGSKSSGSEALLSKMSPKKTHITWCAAACFYSL